MTSLAWTIRTLAGRFPARPRTTVSSPTRITVSRGWLRAKSSVPGTTSDGPWSPPIASTATRTAASRVTSVGDRRGSVTASARGVVGGTAGRLGRDRKATLVVAAVRTDAVGQLHLVAVRTLLELGQVDGEVRAALALAGVRDASLGYTHGVVGSLCRMSWRAAAVR